MYPIHLDLGFRVFHYYEGLYFFVSILVAAILAVRALRKAGLDAGRFLDSLVWILLGAFLGARLFHFAFWDGQAFLQDPLGFFRFWEGGLSITGGLAGGALVGWLAFRKHGFWSIFAAASPAVLVGQALGRLGCFLNGDAWGTPTTLPWGVALPKFGTYVPGFVKETSLPSDAWTWSVASGFTDPSALETVPLHPVQLYEAFGDLLLAGLILWMTRGLRAGGPAPKRVFWVHIGGYSLLRFALEFMHGDRDVTVWAGMTALQLVLALCALAAGILFARTPTRA